MLIILECYTFDIFTNNDKKLLGLNLNKNKTKVNTCGYLFLLASEKDTIYYFFLER